MTFAWNGDTKRNKSMKLNLKTREKHNIRSKLNENKLERKATKTRFKEPFSHRFNAIQVSAREFRNENHLYV